MGDACVDMPPIGLNSDRCACSDIHQSICDHHWSDHEECFPAGIVPEEAGKIKDSCRSTCLPECDACAAMPPIGLNSDRCACSDIHHSICNHHWSEHEECFEGGIVPERAGKIKDSCRSPCLPEC